MKKHKGYHGSPKETHKVHGGAVAGAGQLTLGGNPGAAALRKKSKIGNAYEAPAKGPKGKIPTYAEE